MNASASRLLFASLTLVLWVVPSIGTQGMGTIGARLIHPDAVLIDTVPADRLDARRRLIAADAMVETGLGLARPPV